MFFIILLIVIIACFVIGYIQDKKEKEKEEQSIREKLNLATKRKQEIARWWVGSKFNSFEIVKKYTDILSKDDRYRQVLRQKVTNKYFDRACKVTDYYAFEEGDDIKLNYVQEGIPYLTREVLEEFNKETGLNVTNFYD